MHRRASSSTRMAAPLALLALLATVGAPGARAFGLDFLRPLRLLEAVSAFFREHNAYPEKHVRETSASKVAAMGPFDFVVVGAGVGGAAVAARLSEEKDWKVLLLEAGKDENTLTDVPVLSAVWQSTPFNWGYRTEPRPDVCLAMNDHRCSWPRGKVIGQCPLFAYAIYCRFGFLFSSAGGTSVINYMVHTRGHRLDYDAWAAAGNEGWSYDDVLPYFKRNERVLIDEYAHAEDRGHDGPLNVERVPYSTPLSHAFVRAGRELGYPQVDYNAQGPTGFSLIQATMRNGSRCSANKAYLRPARDRDNLFITSKAQVTRVIIDPKTKHATGVEFMNGHSTWKVFAKKEVILSAGVFNSPQLLMLSGVGPKEHLKELDIPLVQDLKVGYNLMEHYGFLGTTFIAVGYVRTPRQDDGTGDERPSVELLFVGATLASDDGTAVPLGLGLKRSDYNAYFAPLTFHDGFTIWPLVMQPKSRGRVTLRSRDPFDAPLLQANLFSHPHDMEVSTGRSRHGKERSSRSPWLASDSRIHRAQVLIEGIKMAVRVGQSKAFARFGAHLHARPVPGCEGVAFGSDAYWACAARHLTAVLHHTSGTCKMGPRSDPDAVVDPQLRVHGLEALRVVDASVIPVVPTGHTTAPTYMIAEKAADLIKKAWGRL
ncbi:Uncharacterized protein GBIM_07251 [Gryllus bimaculatus]|nr:Uncharacterized protein GBIM_07251 [Gryllus bimaculatus]